MKTKFIGIDGYGEIKSVPFSSKKKRTLGQNAARLVRVVRETFRETAEERREKKLAAQRLERHYTQRRSQGSQRLSTKLAEASAMGIARSRARGRELKQKIASPNFLRGKVALGLAASLVAVTLCVMVPTGSFIATSAVQVPKTEKKNAVRVNDTKLARTVHRDISESMSDEILTDGYGLYIDGVLAGVSLDKEALKSALQKALDDYKAKYDDETTDEFANNVEIVFGAYRSADIDDSENIVKKNLDRFSFSLSTDVSFNEDIPYDTVVKYSDSHYVGYSKVKQKGIDGVQNITCRATYVDGVLTDSVVTKVKTLKKAQKKIIVEGTKEKAVSSSSYSDYSSSSSSTGGFIWPLPYTYNLTSTYGPRWGSFHSGIDIAAGGVYGQTIVASDGGTVEWAGYDSSGYGNYVIIDHGNGYKTLYGHCSALYVSSGQYVSQGDSIAAVGSTGDSTGPHLHFEVRTSDGSRLDPLGFVG